MVVAKSRHRERHLFEPYSIARNMFVCLFVSSPVIDFLVELLLSERARRNRNAATPFLNPMQGTETQTLDRDEHKILF